MEIKIMDSTRSYPELHTLGVAILMVERRLRAINFKYVSSKYYVHERVPD